VLSLVGSQVTIVALALTAVLTLHATPVAMGGLAAAEDVPYLPPGLFSGAWVHRLRR